MSGGLPRIALVGLRGAGKSSVGRALASLVRAPFVDLDREIARVERKRTGRAARAGALLRERGEAAFRDVEEAALAAVIARGGGWVLATGGGAVERAATRSALASAARIVWLDPPLEELVRRIAASGDERPPLTEAPTVFDELAILDARRRPLYAALAELHVAGPDALDQPVRIASRIAVALT